MGEEIAKPIRLSEHAARYALTRGFEAAEVRRAIREAPWQRVWPFLVARWLGPG